jgi:hypothetical protein
MHLDSTKEMERFLKMEGVGVEPNSGEGMFGGISPLSSTGYALSILKTPCRKPERGCCTCPPEPIRPPSESRRIGPSLNRPHSDGRLTL